MAKQSGLGDQLYIDGFSVGGDIGSLSAIAGGNSPLDVTGIDKSGHERLGGKRDGRIEFTSFFNDETNPLVPGAHQVLKTRPTVDRIVTYLRGSAAGGQAASMVAKQINYDPTRGDDGSLTFDIAAQANGFGLEWGTFLGLFNFASPGQTAGVDFGAASTFGLQAYLHLVLFSGTSVTLTIQESSDNGGGDPYANVSNGAFAAASVIGAQRIATPNNQSIERWLRVAATGTFSAAVGIVTAVRNPIAGQVF